MNAAALARAVRVWAFVPLDMPDSLVCHTVVAIHRLHSHVLILIWKPAVRGDHTQLRAGQDCLLGLLNMTCRRPRIVQV